MSRWRENDLPAPLALSMEPGTKWYQRSAHGGGHLNLFVSPPLGDQGWHMSISHRLNSNPPRPGRNPTWEEIRDARYEFIPDAVTMAMFLPPRAEYVNLHATTFHLHQVPGEGGAGP
jgi:hypothetical protein